MPRDRPAADEVSVEANHVASVRRSNLGAILRLLRDHGARSRSQIGRETGLPKATVSALVLELLDRRLVREAGFTASRGIGRPSQQVELDGRGVCGLGVEISSTYVRAVALDLPGKTVFRAEKPLDVGRMPVEQVMDTTAELIQSCLNDTADRQIDLLRVVVATPGVVDVEKGIVRFAANLGWHDVPVTSMLRQRLGRPTPAIEVENDARAASVAELAQYARDGVTDLLLLTGERGVGGGIIANGRLLRGSAGFAGEIGHTPLGPPDVACVCGRHGCWETQVGMQALLDQAADADDPVRDALRPIEERLDELYARAQAGDARVLDALHQVSASLCKGLEVLSDVLNPRVIVLGGYFARFAEYLIPALQRRFDERALIHPVVPQTAVVPSKLGFGAASLGAAGLALQPVFRDPTRGTVSPGIRQS
ncbi:ROK family transcriptional regulator [Streptomyces sp. RKAG293]|uniref:ROK family transcriptional regulator n=1 Tax=Streptomyces sp. RKAG293 TaxID=2893403 RepID=UPI0020346B18|nr:ROK family transcriptional regulator [Streptomyces sp. RKAG293]MCM2416817.1 ROK family protein [Streptomyces sp. RKAG293]